MSAMCLFPHLSHLSSVTLFQRGLTDSSLNASAISICTKRNTCMFLFPSLLDCHGVWWQKRLVRNCQYGIYKKGLTLKHAPFEACTFLCHTCFGDTWWTLLQHKFVIFSYSVSQQNISRVIWSQSFALLLSVQICCCTFQSSEFLAGPSPPLTLSQFSFLHRSGALYSFCCFAGVPRHSDPLPVPSSLRSSVCKC